MNRPSSPTNEHIADPELAAMVEAELALAPVVAALMEEAKRARDEGVTIMPLVSLLRLELQALRTGERAEALLGSYILGYDDLSLHDAVAVRQALSGGWQYEVTDAWGNWVITDRRTLLARLEAAA